MPLLVATALGDQLAELGEVEQALAVGGVPVQELGDRLRCARDPRVA